MQSSTKNQVAFVFKSFEKACIACPDLGSRFYDQLVKDHKEIAERFHSVSMGAQHTRFVSMFHIILTRMIDKVPVTDLLQKLGKRHADFNLQDEDFKQFGLTLANVIRNQLEDECNEEWTAAWAAVYHDVTHSMKAAIDAPSLKQ